MKNTLDNTFYKNLKDQTQIPEEIHFNSEKLKQQIDSHLTDKSERRRIWIPAAVLLLIIGLSTLNIYQHNVICNKDMLLAEKQEKIVEINNQLQITQTKSNQFKETLAAKTSKNEEVQQRNLVVLKPLPSIDIKYQVVYHIHPIQIQKVPVLITQNAIDQSNIVTDPEIKLPVFYESEKLAMESDQPNKKGGLLNKLRRSINN